MKKQEAYQFLTDLTQTGEVDTFFLTNGSKLWEISEQDLEPVLTGEKITNPNLIALVKTINVVSKSLSPLIKE